MRTLLNGSAVASHSCTWGTPASAAVIAAMKPAAPPPATTKGTGEPASGIRHKGQGHAVVAVALTGGTRAVIEDMALVTTAAAAVVFGAGNDQAEIDLGVDRIGQRLPKTGPTGAAIELRAAGKQGLLTARANEGAWRFSLFNGLLKGGSVPS